MDLSEAKQILNKSGYLLEEYSVYKKEKIVKFSYLYCLLKSYKEVDMQMGAEYALQGNINFILDGINIYISHDSYDAPNGTNKSDTVFMIVLVDETYDSSREKELDFNTLISTLEKGNLNKIKEIALEIKNDESLELYSEDV